MSAVAGYPDLWRQAQGGAYLYDPSGKLRGSVRHRDDDGLDGWDDFHGGIHDCQGTAERAVETAIIESLTPESRPTDEKEVEFTATCVYCLGTIPSQWNLRFPEPDGTGVVKDHHEGCVMDRLERGRKAERLLVALVERVEELGADPNQPSCLQLMDECEAASDFLAELQK